MELSCVSLLTVIWSFDEAGDDVNVLVEDVDEGSMVFVSFVCLRSDNVLASADVFVGNTFATGDFEASLLAPGSGADDKYRN